MDLWNISRGCIVRVLPLIALSRFSFVAAPSEIFLCRLMQGAIIALFTINQLHMKTCYSDWIVELLFIECAYNELFM